MKYFTIEELCKSDTATRLGIENKPSEEHKQNMIALIENVLEPAREKLGKPIKVSSGYRGFQLNKAVGGVKSSQHCKGQAVDIVCHNNYELIRILQEQNNFDQLIWEKGKSAPQWIHVSYVGKSANRKQKLKTYDGKNYVTISKF